MPSHSRAQVIGAAGETWFQAQLPPAWLAQRPTHDVGVDFVVVVCEQGVLNGREFRVQIKSSASIRPRNGLISLPGVKRSTLDYWFVSPLPTMLVAFDHATSQGFYQWHHTYAQAVWREDGSAATKSITLKVPVANALTPTSWQGIRESIHWHYSNLGAALRAARNARSVLPTVHVLASAARYLNSIDQQPIPPEARTHEQHGILGLIESFQHRDVIAAVTRLLAELAPDSDGAVRLTEWLANYREKVSRVLPNLDAMPIGDSVPLDYQIAVATEAINHIRPGLIQDILTMIMLLTPASSADEG